MMLPTHAELSQSKKEEVTRVGWPEHAKDIIDLSRYDEDSAGGLMGKRAKGKQNHALHLRKRVAENVSECILFM
jgi:hypothetical protein